MALVLHWSAPGAFPLPPTLANGEATGGFSSVARASQPGSLPRLAPRKVASESHLPKPNEQGLLAGGKLAGLLAGEPVARWRAAPASDRHVGEIATRAAWPRAFAARAPPAATA
jgi:hypothetical protein